KLVAKLSLQVCHDKLTSRKITLAASVHAIWVGNDEISFDKEESLENIQDDVPTLKDSLQNSLHNNRDLQNATKNDVSLPSSKSSYNSHETSTIIGDEVETVEVIQEDTSALQALYLENQQDAFDEFVNTNFPITRLPNNVYCLEWLLKHAECYLRNSV
ncbi:hypothetical protein AVEN_156432-1, partial [Araneus ventricosus]